MSLRPWIEEPVNYVCRLLENHVEKNQSFLPFVLDSFRDRLNLNCENIPVLSPDHPGPPVGQLCILHGMVSDVKDPEVFMLIYRDTSGSFKTGLFKDQLDMKDFEAIDQKNIIHGDRQCFVMSNIPGENSWVPREIPSYVHNEEPSSAKMARMDPNVRKGIEVKFYGDESENQLNHVYNLFGVFEKTSEQVGESTEEHLIFHCILSQKQLLNNPLLTEATGNGLVSDQREKIMNVLLRCVKGDSIVAELLLLHLMSSVHSRADLLPLGKFSVNVHNCEEEIARNISELLSLLTPMSSTFEMTIDSLNNTKLVPNKDVENDIMISGLLQLPPNYHLVINELNLEPGQLTVTGLKNLAAIQNLVQWQKLNICYKFQSVEIPSNVGVLLLSKGSSLIKSCDISVKLEQKGAPDDGFIPSEEELNQMRIAISVGKSLTVEVGERMCQFIQNEFVHMRQQNESTVTSDDLHMLLNMSRIMAASFGQQQLTEENWRRTKTLIDLVKSRK